jgi:hypothetical protein
MMREAAQKKRPRVKADHQGLGGNLSQSNDETRIGAKGSRN